MDFVAHTFSSFIVGASNRDAYDACLRVVEQPGQLHNPLMIANGESGNGATHLTEATAMALGIPMLSAERLTDELKRDNAFGRYLDGNGLAVDGIGFLESKEVLSERVAAIVAGLVGRGKQVVVNGFGLDYLPAALKAILQGSFVARIHRPELELRRTKVRQLAARDRITLSDQDIEQLACASERSIRTVEGAYNRTRARAF